MDPESRDAASETVSQNRPLGCLAQVFGHRGAKGIDVMPMVVYLYMALWGRMFEETDDNLGRQEHRGESTLTLLALQVSLCTC